MFARACGRVSAVPSYPIPSHREAFARPQQPAHGSARMAWHVSIWGTCARARRIPALRATLYALRSTHLCCCSGGCSWIVGGIAFTQGARGPADGALRGRRGRDRGFGGGSRGRGEGAAGPVEAVFGLLAAEVAHGRVCVELEWWGEGGERRVWVAVWANWAKAESGGEAAVQPRSGGGLCRGAWRVEGAKGMALGGLLVAV